MSATDKVMDLLQRAKQLRADGFTTPASWPSGLQRVDASFYNGLLAPVSTPLRNKIPRVAQQGQVQATWKAITGININDTQMGVDLGKRGGSIEHTLSEFTAAFRTIGLEDFVHDEAQLAAQGLVDAKMACADKLALAFMIGEEHCILGGNTGVALGQCVTPTVSLGTAVAGCTNGNLTVQVVALSTDAYWRLKGINNGKAGIDNAVGVVDPNDVALATRTNMDGSTSTIYGGVGKVSSASGAVTIDGTHKDAYAYTTAIPGAAGYAWYWGVNGGTRYLGAVTTTNGVHITADASTSVAVGANLASDCSRSTLLFDGLISIAATSGSGAYVAAQATGTPGTGTVLATDGYGGVTALNTYFADRWSLYSMGPSRLLMSAKTRIALTNAALATGATNAVVVSVPMISDGNVATGRTVTQILNGSSGQMVAVETHSYMPDGMILGIADTIPYPLPGVGNICQIVTQQDMYMETWQRVTRRQDYGMYAVEVLQHFYPPALGLIYNIPV